MRFEIDDSREIHPLLNSYKPIVRGLAGTLGESGEVVLHDLSNPESSLVMVAGNVTDRDVGAPCTDLVLGQLRSGGEPEDMLNYLVKMGNGRTIRASTIFIRDFEGRVIGCLGINIDLTEMIMARDTLSSLCAVESDENAGERDEIFARSIGEIMEGMIARARRRVGRPVPYMDKGDKLEVIKHLDRRGAFLVRGAVDTVARHLGVSRYTIYNYLKEIETADDGAHRATGGGSSGAGE